MDIFFRRAHNEHSLAHNEAPYIYAYFPSAGRLAMPVRQHGNNDARRVSGWIQLIGFSNNLRTAQNKTGRGMPC